MSISHAETLLPGILLLCPILAALAPSGSHAQSVMRSRAGLHRQAGPGAQAGQPGRGARVLSLTLTEPANGSFDEVIETARSIGARTTSLPVFWDDLEVAPGVFQPSVNYLAIANSYYPTQGVSLILGIHPIDTNRLRLPSDLVSLPFDHPEVRSRFRDLLDWVATQVQDLELVSLSLGNEVDAFLANDATAWAAYGVFFEDVSAHARSLFPGVPLGVKTTFDGTVGSTATHARSLHLGADAVFMTYYPLRVDFTVRPIHAVRRDLNRVFNAYPSMPVFLLEAGCPSGALCGSSEQVQADFVRALFSVWDQNPLRMPLVEFVWLHDVSPAAVAGFQTYYGISDPIFVEYLATLGLREYAGAGADKLAFSALAYEARSRGW